MREGIVTVGGLHYRRATWPRRIAARVVDITILVPFCVLPGEKFLPFTIPLSIVYLFLGNGLLAGRSIGKRVAGLKIIDALHGGPITPVQDFVRHRYLFFYNPIFLLLTAIDTSQGYFEKPETYVVGVKPLPPEEIEILKEKPAKLDLEAMRKSLQRPR